MSEIPTALLGILVLALLLTMHDRKRPGIVCLAVGGLLGFAFTIRSDNVLLFVPAVLLLAWEGPGRERFQRVGLLLAGMAPFLVGLALYNQATFGSPWQTGYRYWGNAGSAKVPLFSTGYITKSGFMRLQGMTDQYSSVEGNGTFYMKSLLNQSDASHLFLPLPWPLPVLRLCRTAALLRTALGAVGLLACLATWRTNRLRQRFLLWAFVITVASIGLFLMYFYRDERYLARLVPVFCLANGVGVAALFARWPSKAARVAVLGVVGTLIGSYIVLTPRMGLPAEEPRGIYETLTRIAGHIETNAVVVSNFHPLCLDAYLIHGTHRRAVPLEDKDAIQVFLGGDLTLTSFCPFVATRDPERLRELLRSGAPVYWLFHASWHKREAPELMTLGQSFRLTVLTGDHFQSRSDRFESRPGQLFFGGIEELAPQNWYSIK